MMTFTTKRCLLLLILLPMLLAGGGCNTVAGVGEDLEAAGDELEQAAEREQRY